MPEPAGDVGELKVDELDSLPLYQVNDLACAESSLNEITVLGDLVGQMTKASFETDISLTT